MLADAYGDETLSIAEAAVDREVTAKKDATGNIASMDVTVRATEHLRDSTVATGVCLPAIDAPHKVVRTATPTPSLANAYAVSFSLSGPEWSALTAGASAISVSVTKDLRAAAWGATLPLFPAPAWALAVKPVYSMTNLNLEP